MKRAKLMIRLLYIPVIIAALLMALAGPASAQFPVLPHAFYGSVELNGEPAPVGTVIEVRGEGIDVGSEGNPIVITEAGKYGTADIGVKLVAQGEDIEGNPVLSFYVDGVKAEQTYVWESGGITSLDLSATGSSYSSSSIDETEDESSTGQTRTLKSVMFGKSVDIDISDTGEIQETVKISAELSNGMIEANIKKGTTALSQSGEPLNSLTSEADATPPRIPADYAGIILPCDFGPDGATFDPPIVLTFHYEPSDIPEGTDEGELVIAFYDDSAGEWQELASDVDVENNTVVASVSHFTSFAILAPEAEAIAEPAQATTEPGTPTQEESATAPTPGTTSPVSEQTDEGETETSPATPADEPLPADNNTWIFWVIIGIAVVIIAFFVIRKVAARGQ